MTGLVVLVFILVVGGAARWRGVTFGHALGQIARAGGFVIVAVLALLLLAGTMRSCISVTPQCPPGEQFVVDPGSPFGDGECQ